MYNSGQQRDVNRHWHKGEYKTLEKDLGYTKEPQHSKTQWVNYSDFYKDTTPMGSQTHNSPPAEGKKLSYNKPTP